MFETFFKINDNSVIKFEDFHYTRGGLFNIDREIRPTHTAMHIFGQGGIRSTLGFRVLGRRGVASDTSLRGRAFTLLPHIAYGGEWAGVTARARTKRAREEDARRGGGGEGGR